jgi:hypothetical protein
MKFCTATEYLEHGYFATSVTQIELLIKLHVYAVRAALHADWGHVERAEDFAVMAASLAFIAFPDLRGEKVSAERAA